MKKWIFIAIFLFSLGLAFGFATPSRFLSGEVAAIKELGAFLTSLPPVLLFLFLLLKNASALALSFLLSPILCLMPIMTLTLNGWLLAFVSAEVAQEKSLGFVLAGVLPHGIFELPALILGEAAALSFGAMATIALLKKESRGLLLPNLKQNLRYLLAALALLVPAAIIEAFITPLLLR